MRVSEATAAYITQQQGDGRSIHTTKQSERFLRKLATELRDPPIATVRHEDLARFLASAAVTKRADGGARKANSANALRSVVRSFFAFSHAAGYCATNPARLIRRARCAPPRPKALAEHEAERLVAALDTATTPTELRDRAMFRTTLGLGLRVGSLIALDVADVDFENASVRVRTLKGRDEDEVYATPDLVELLRAYVANRRTGPLFAGSGGERLGSRQVARRLEGWTQRAGIQRQVSPHALRHTFAMRVFARTGDVLVTARALCHRSLASTAVYARPSEARVR
jgi:site-specific recombinase XerD